jgi:hypothetical protein
VTDPLVTAARPRRRAPMRPISNFRVAPRSRARTARCTPGATWRTPPTASPSVPSGRRSAPRRGGHPAPAPRRGGERRRSAGGALRGVPPGALRVRAGAPGGRVRPSSRASWTSRSCFPRPSDRSSSGDAHVRRVPAGSSRCRSAGAGRGAGGGCQEQLTSPGQCPALPRRRRPDARHRAHAPRGTRQHLHRVRQPGDGWRSWSPTASPSRRIRRHTGSPPARLDRGPRHQPDLHVDSVALTSRSWPATPW